MMIYNYAMHRVMIPKLLLFDADGVLFKTDTAVSRGLTHKFGLSDDNLGPMWRGLYNQLSRGTFTTDEFLKQFAHMYNLAPDDVHLDDFVVAYKEALKPMPGIEELLDDLSARHHTMALLSDTSEMFHMSRRDLRLFQHFDNQFLSYETGHRKPDELAYRKVIDHYHLKPKDVLFIDDSATNIAGAQRLGIDGIQFEGTTKLRKMLRGRSML